MILTFSIYLTIWFMFLAGQASHLFFIKMPSLRERSGGQNKVFLFVDWWNCDWNIILGTQVLGIALTVGLPEILNWNPVIWSYVRWFFFFVGVFASSIFMAFFSRYSKQINALADAKANVSDTLLGSISTTVHDVKEKASSVGIDATKPPEKK